jgi:hypothetical protein
MKVGGSERRGRRGRKERTEGGEGREGPYLKNTKNFFKTPTKFIPSN